MNEAEITNCLITELSKLVLRSGEKTEDFQEGALKFVSAHAHAFRDAQALAEEMGKGGRIRQLFALLFGEEEEPCLLPFTPGQFAKDAASGFLVHIFKGEQDIVPLSKEKIAITPKQYYRLFHTLRHDLKRLDAPLGLETWLHLLQRYTKWVPAGGHLPHVSLYDYARIKMALVAALTPEQADAWCDKQEKGDACEDKELGLAGVQIFGKEEFLQALGANEDQRKFKGAAYCLQLVRECLTQDFLKGMGLPPCNCLLDADDRIVFLIPASARAKFEEKQRETEGFLLRHFGGILGISTHFAPLSIGDLKAADFGRIWGEIESKLESGRDALFAGYLSGHPEDSALLFGAEGGLGGPNDGEERGRCFAALAESCAELADTLGKTRWVAVSPAAPEQEIRMASDWQGMLRHFGMRWDLLPKKPEPAESLRIYRFGNTDFACPNGEGFKFSETLSYLASEQANEPLPSHWSVVQLRIDPFQEEIPHNLWSYLTTREYLRDFFRTYLSSLLREKKYRKHTYVVHSADRSLTMVCSPQVALMLAKQVAQKFSQFGSDKFTLLGRISVYPSEYPIGRALFEEQKEFALQAGSNRITVMGESLSWGFLETILRTQEKLSTIAKLRGKRFLFALWGIAERYRLQARKYRTKKDSQMWRHMAGYYLFRMGISDNLEVERGPLHLSLAIQWNHLMSEE